MGVDPVKQIDFPRVLPQLLLLFPSLLKILLVRIDQQEQAVPVGHRKAADCQVQIGRPPQPRVAHNHEDIRLCVIRVHSVDLRRGFANHPGQRMGRGILLAFLPDLARLEVFRNGKNPIVTG